MRSLLWILASKSPRRRQLLRDGGYDFRVEAPEIEELDAAAYPDMTPRELVRANAKQKALAVAAKNPGKNILAADTIVVCKGKVLGKPADLTEARRMLEWMSGSTHEVLTAVVWTRLNNASLPNESSPADFMKEALASTRVRFRQLDETDISRYLKTVHVLDKAGAYALQDHGEWIIECIEGSRSNVIGLPMEIMEKWLCET